MKTKTLGYAAAICGLLMLGPAGVLTVAQAKTVVVKRTTVYVATLPKGCVKTTYNGGVAVWRCGQVYYQPYKGRYVRVYIK